MATLEAYYSHEGTSLDYTPASAVTAGTITQFGDGSAGVPANDIAASVQGSRTKRGVFKVASASATTFSEGEEVWWDDSAGAAVAKSASLDGDADFYLGLAAEAKASGPTYVYVELNAHRPPFDPIVYEFDCEAGTLNEAHVLVPAEMNPRGLVITAIFGLVTEAFAGGTEDQGVVTVSDESDNALATLTPSDAGADDLNDIIEGLFLQEQATGAAAKVVAAGEYIDAAITQKTSGTSAAGKMKVFIQAVPLV